MLALPWRCAGTCSCLLPGTVMHCQEGSTSEAPARTHETRNRGHACKHKNQQGMATSKPTWVKMLRFCAHLLFCVLPRV